MPWLECHFGMDEAISHLDVAIETKVCSNYEPQFSSFNSTSSRRIEMQNNNGIAANEGTALRELSLDEAEMVGGGFSWGGLVHSVEHVAGNIAGDVAGAAAVGFGAVAGGGLAKVGGKVAVKLWRAAENFKLPKMPDEPGPGPELPPEIWLG
jgi:hypothetical protein